MRVPRRRRAIQLFGVDLHRIHVAPDRLQPGRTRQGVQFIQIVSLQAFSLGGHGQQRSPLGVGRVRVVLAGDVLVLQWEPPSDWNSMARLGTTVEMACL